MTSPTPSVFSESQDPTNDKPSTSAAPQERPKIFAFPINAVLMQGVDSSITLPSLEEVVKDLIQYPFDIAKVDLTSVVVLPDSPGSDVDLLEEILINIMAALKSGLVGVYTNIEYCWVNKDLEVSIPSIKPEKSEKAKTKVKPDKIPAKSSSDGLSIAKNSFALLAAETENQDVNSKGKNSKKEKGKAKEVIVEKDVWDDSTEDLTQPIVQEQVPTKSIPTSNVQSKNLINFHNTIEEENVVEDWTSLLPSDHSDSEEDFVE